MNRMGMCSLCCQAHAGASSPAPVWEEQAPSQQYKTKDGIAAYPRQALTYVSLQTAFAFTAMLSCLSSCLISSMHWEMYFAWGKTNKNLCSFTSFGDLQHVSGEKQQNSSRASTRSHTLLTDETHYQETSQFYYKNKSTLRYFLSGFLSPSEWHCWVHSWLYKDLFHHILWGLNKTHHPWNTHWSLTSVGSQRSLRV